MAPASEPLPVTEAARFICGSLTLEYRRECLKFWRETFGDHYAISVEKEVLKQWRKHARPRA